MITCETMQRKKKKEEKNIVIEGKRLLSTPAQQPKYLRLGANANVPSMLLSFQQFSFKKDQIHFTIIFELFLSRHLP